MKKTAFFLPTFSALTLASALLFASAEQAPTDSLPPTQENPLFNSRPLAQDKREFMEKQREEEAKEEERILQTSNKNAAPIFKLALKSTGKAEIVLANGANYFPMDHHWVYAFPEYNVVKLEDESEWTVSSNDAHIIRSWRTGDALYISPNNTLFASTPYHLTNATLDSTVRVTPFVGPKALGTYTHWVVGIDKTYGQVYLINGKSERTTWQINPAEAYLFNEWQVNDTIIIGLNKSWPAIFRTWDNILVNVNMNHYIRANQR